MLHLLLTREANITGHVCLIRMLSLFNEIVQGTMKSSLCSGEICFADEIKSVLQPDEVGLHHKVISPIEDEFIPPVRTDLIEKSTCFRKCFFLGADNGTFLSGYRTVHWTVLPNLLLVFPRQVWRSFQVPDKANKKQEELT